MTLVILMGQFRRNVSSAVFRNQMEDRLLRNKLGSIELEQSRLLRQFRSETRLMKIRQEQRLQLGNLTFTRRNEVNGSHMNKAGNPSPPSVGATCQLDFAKLQFRYDKRRSSTTIYSCGECPVNAGDAFLTDEEWTQPSRRLPRFPSMDGKRTPEPLCPTSKDSCQSPVTVNRKATGNPSIIVQDSMTSADKAVLREAHETKGILGGNHGNGYKSNSFVTVEPHKKSNGPRVRRQTWNGQVLPKLPEPQPVTNRNRSYSDKDQPHIHRQSSLSDSTEANLDDISCFPSDENVFVTDLKTSWNKSSTCSKKTFPTVEGAVRGNFLSVPKHQVSKSNSLNSLKALELGLPPVLESEDCQAASMGYKADEVSEGNASGTEPLPVGSKETENPGPVFLSSQRRHQRFSRQENVTRDPSSSNASQVPTGCSLVSSRNGESGSGAAKKVSVKYKTGQNVNKQGELANKETIVLKDTSTKREKLAATSKSLSSSLGQCSKEEIQMEITKRKESIKPRKRVLDKGRETKEEEVAEPMDKPSWMKALRKVFNMNTFLRGMVALRKQRELDHLALKTKQDALGKLYQELEHCRYLRLPSNEDNEKIDFISWVFEKD